MISYAITQNIEEEEGFRVVKALQDGVVTPFISEGFGEDSHPLKDMTAIMATTEADGESVVIGYLDVEKISEIGEKRLFSLRPDGDLSAYLWLKNDGKIHLNGNEDFLVKYNELKKKCDELQLFINTELKKIQLGISQAGGAYTPSNLDFDISSSKAEDLLCK